MFSVFKNINKFAGRWKFLDYFAIFCARFLPFFIIVFLILFFLFQNNLRVLSLCILSGLFARYAVNEAIYVFYKKQRPAGIKNTKVLIPIPKNPSFPSGHASLFFGISFLLFFHNLVFGIIFLVLSFLIGMARVFCGAHWGRDILAGAGAGAMATLLINYLVKI